MNPAVTAPAFNSDRRLKIQRIIIEMVSGLEWREMESNNSRTKILIKEFLRGKLPPGLQARAGEWISRIREEDETGDALQEIFDEMAALYPRPNLRTHRQWRQFCRRCGIEDSRANKVLLHKRLVRIAAVLVPLLATCMGLLYFNTSTDVLPNEAPSYMAIEAGHGTRMVTTLPCGTEVILGDGSQIEYDEKGFKESRKVSLNGRAFFSVTKTQGETFEVEAGDVTITVLGTEFNVNTTDSGTEVSLFSGSLSVTANGSSVMLEPGRQFIYDKARGTVDVTGFNAEQVGAWRKTLILDNVPLEEAFRMIGTHYGVDIQVGSLPQRNRKVRANFRDNTLGEVLEIIQQAHDDFDFRISADTVYINEK